MKRTVAVSSLVCLSHYVLKFPFSYAYDLSYRFNETKSLVFSIHLLAFIDQLFRFHKSIVNEYKIIENINLSGLKRSGNQILVLYKQNNLTAWVFKLLYITC